MNIITIILFVLIILQELQIIRLNKQVFVLNKQVYALTNLLGQQVIKMVVDQDALDKLKDKDTDD